MCSPYPSQMVHPIATSIVVYIMIVVDKGAHPFLFEHYFS